MLVINTLRILSFLYFLFLFFAPPRYIIFHPTWLYYIFILSYIFLSLNKSIIRFKNKLCACVLVMYAFFPFIDTIYMYISCGELVSAIVSSSGLLWIISPLFLPILILLEYITKGDNRDMETKRPVSK